MRAVVDAVAGMLRAAGVGDVFCIAPSALLSEQPVVVRWAGFSRESRQDGEERGVASVEVFAVRETDAAARDAAFLCEAAVRSSGRAVFFLSSCPSLVPRGPLLSYLPDFLRHL